MKKYNRKDNQVKVSNWIESVMIVTLGVALVTRIVSVFMSGPVGDGLYYGSLIFALVLMLSRAIWWLVSKVRNRKIRNTKCQAGS